MSIQGELTIDLLMGRDGLQCDIRSSRPLSAARVFAGKSVEFTLNSLPLLFNVCARAQSSSLVRAIESAQGLGVTDEVASQREALVMLESLREQVLRVLMAWPTCLAETAINPALGNLVQGVSLLSESMKPAVLYACSAVPQQLGHQQREQWQRLSTFLAKELFASDFAAWLNEVAVSSGALAVWAANGQTQAARFLHWLAGQTWRNAGSSPVTGLPAASDEDLMDHLVGEQEAFTAQPQWEGACHELSWFVTMRENPVVSELLRENGNGIHTRSVARLLAIAGLMQRLDGFFQRGEMLPSAACDVPGMAHVEAARGRLTHCVALDGDTVSQLLVLAPTEWNFHPRGVAAQGLENLQANDEAELRQQARLLIHAIDPCVGYTLNMVRT